MLWQKMIDCCWLVKGLGGVRIITAVHVYHVTHVNVYLAFIFDSELYNFQT